MRGSGELRGGELPMEVLRAIEAGDMLQMDVLERGGAEGEVGELGSEGAMLILQSDELASELEAIILPINAEQPAMARSGGGLDVEELQRRLEESEERSRLLEAKLQAVSASSSFCCVHVGQRRS